MEKSCHQVSQFLSQEWFVEKIRKLKPQFSMELNMHAASQNIKDLQVIFDFKIITLTILTSIFFAFRVFNNIIDGFLQMIEILNMSFILLNLSKRVLYSQSFIICFFFVQTHLRKNRRFSLLLSPELFLDN